MYGKFFASAFTGSMFGAGADVFSVWGYVIAHAVAGRVELNPRMLAASIGAPVERMELAIEFLCSPDPHSRNPAEEGRRLVLDGAYQYRVTSHEIYRGMQTEEHRREYNRVKQQESRARRAVKPSVNAVSIDGQCQSPIQKTEAEAYTEANTRDHLALVDRDHSEHRGSNAHTPRASVKPEPAVTGNPHHKPTNLINGSDLRRHGTHAWCSDREGLCLNHALHKEFIAKSAKPEAEVKAWYAATMEKFKSVPIGDDGFHFWRNEFAAWIGTVTSKPTGRRVGAAPGAADRIAARFAAKERA